MSGSSKPLEINLALLLLLSAGVIFLKFSFTNAINLFFIGTYFLLWCNRYLIKKETLVYNHAKGKIILFFFFLFIIHFSFFFFFRGQNDHFTFDFAWYLVFLTILFVDRSILMNSVRVFGNILFWISLFALGNYFISIIGFQLPFIEFKSAIRDSTYYIYPGTVRLLGQDYEILGRTGFRLVGIFPEPSMLGILCAFILYSDTFKNLKFKKTIIQITLLLSLSTGAIIMSLGYILTIIKNTKARIGFILSLLSISLLFVFYVPKELIDRFFINKVSGDVINNRSTQEFDSFYSSFLNSNDFFHLLFGYGVDILDVNSFVASDYRGLLMKFGVIGLLLVFLLFSSFLNKRNGRVIPKQFLFIFLVLFAHRAWLLIVFVIIFFMYYLSNKEEIEYDY